jgi:lysozyme
MIEQLREELVADEGCIYVVYLDHLGLKTVGIGHLCRESDPEFNMEVGDPVSEERVAELFAEDISWTISDCHKLLPGFNDLPETVQLIVANMTYNMGLNRMGKFVKFLAAVEAGDMNEAADEMYDSRWRRQVPERSGRLIAKMRALA